MAKQKTTASTTDKGLSPGHQEKKDKDGEDRTGEELLRCLRALIKGVLNFTTPHQSVKIVSLAVSGGLTTLAKDVGGDQATLIDLTLGPVTVSGTCVNLFGDVEGIMLGLDQNITIVQDSLTTYTGAGSRRWSMVFPQNPPGVPPGADYPVVLQCCFSGGSPLDSLSFKLRVPQPPPVPAIQPAAAGS